METPKEKSMEKEKREETFAQTYANVFERLALKIVKSVFNEKIIASKTTKKTRDSGIDAIIKSSDGNVTIEVKLRKYSYRLGLIAVAMSIIFYILRKNRKHYIVSNVVFANDSFRSHL